jgi:hypothetical protein
VPAVSLPRIGSQPNRRRGPKTMDRFSVGVVRAERGTRIETPWEEGPQAGATCFDEDSSLTARPLLAPPRLSSRLPRLFLASSSPLPRLFLSSGRWSLRGRVGCRRGLRSVTECGGGVASRYRDCGLVFTPNAASTPGGILAPSTRPSRGPRQRPRRRRAVVTFRAFLSDRRREFRRGARRFTDAPARSQ